MKIYPSRHRAYFKKQVSLNDIPLAYVFNNEKDRIVKIEMEPEFGKPYTETIVQPYQKLESDKILLFDSNKALIENTDKYIRSKDGEYIALPQDVYEFTPKTFSYRILLRKADTYNKNVKYNMTFGVDTSDNSVLYQISSIVQNLDNKKEYPSNIRINYGSEMINTFSAYSYLNPDFLFTSSTDIEEIEQKLDSHVNLWILNDSFDGLLEELDIYDEDEDSSYNSCSIQSPMIYAKNGIPLPTYTNEDDQPIAFNIGKKWEKLDGDEYEYIKFFSYGSPVCIIHKKNSGYAILSHPSFFTKLNTLSNDKGQIHLFWEIIMYVFLNSYIVISSSEDVPITDEPIDYLTETSQRYYLCHPRINLIRLLLKNEKNSSINYVVADFNATPIDNTFTVKYVGINRFKDIILKKESTVKDREKGNNILIYTTNKTMAIYNPLDITFRTIESGISIRNIDNVRLGISATRSSKYRIFTTTEQFVDLDTIGDYIVYYNQMAGMFEICFSDEYQESEYYVKIADVNVKDNKDIFYKDVRSPGGGEMSATPNYEMIDTGNLYGRPYRYGCPMIIEVPSRLKSLDKEIKSEVEKHISSGDYPIIVYKD